MKISVYTKFGPINSKKVFDAFIESLKNAGEEIHLNEDNIEVFYTFSRNLKLR